MFYPYAWTDFRSEFLTRKQRKKIYVNIYPQTLAFRGKARKFARTESISYKSYCSTVHFRRITSIYQPTNAHIISHETLSKHFKTLRHILILSDHHQGALFLAKVILQYSQFNSYLQTSCCGSISCCVGMCCGVVARCASHDAHLANYTLYNRFLHNMICCHNSLFTKTN